MPGMNDIQQRINALLKEVRSWDLLEKKYTLHDLAAFFNLDPDLVYRLVASEGVLLPDTPETTPEIMVTDPNATTHNLDPEEIKKALEKPDPDPSWEDEDTGIWKKKPTGEWERVSPTKKSS